MTFHTFSGPPSGSMGASPGAQDFYRFAREPGPPARSMPVAEQSLQSLAQEYTAKLRQAGYSVAQGINALQQPGNSVAKKPAAAAGVATEIGELEAVARTVFGDDAEHWLKHPNHLLGGHTPASLMFAPSGRSKVRQLLKAYELAA